MTNKNKCLQSQSILDHIRSYLKIYEIFKTRSVSKRWNNIDTIPVDMYNYWYKYEKIGNKGYKERKRNYFNIKYLLQLKIIKAEICLDEKNFYQMFNFFQRNHIHLQ